MTSASAVVRSRAVMVAGSSFAGLVADDLGAGEGEEILLVPLGGAASPTLRVSRRLWRTRTFERPQERARRNCCCSRSMAPCAWARTRHASSYTANRCPDPGVASAASIQAEAQVNAIDRFALSL